MVTKRNRWPVVHYQHRWGSANACAFSNASSIATAKLRYLPILGSQCRGFKALSVFPVNLAVSTVWAWLWKSLESTLLCNCFTVSLRLLLWQQFEMMLNSRIATRLELILISSSQSGNCIFEMEGAFSYSRHILALPSGREGCWTSFASIVPASNEECRPNTLCKRYILIHKHPRIEAQFGLVFRMVSELRYICNCCSHPDL